MKLNIGKKMMGAFGIIAFVVLLFSVFVINKLYEYEEDITNFNDVQSEILTSFALQQNILKVQELFTNASLTKDESVLINEVKPTFDSAIELMTQWAEQNSDEPAHLAKLEKLKKDFTKMYKIWS